MSSGAILSSLMDDQSINQSISRPTSAPPDYEFSSTNVFAFGLKNYSSFRPDLNDQGQSTHIEAAASIAHPIRQPLVDDSFNPSLNQWSASSPTSYNRSRLSGSSINQLINPNNSLYQRDDEVDQNNGMMRNAYDQSMNQSMNQSMKQTMNQASLHDQLAQTTATLEALQLAQNDFGYMNNMNNQSMNQPMNQSMNQTMNQTMNQSLNATLNATMNQTMNQPMNALQNPVLNPLLNPAINPSLNLTNAQLSALLQQQMNRLNAAQAIGEPLAIDDRLLLLQLYQSSMINQSINQTLNQSMRAQQIGLSNRKFNNHNNFQNNNYQNNNYQNNHRDGGRNFRGRRGGYNNNNHHQSNFQSNNQHKNRGMDSRYYDNMNDFDGSNGSNNQPFHNPLAGPLSMNTQSGNPALNDDFSDLPSQFNAQSTIEDLTGHVYQLAKDQFGCRLLQRLIDDQTANPASPSNGQGNGQASKQPMVDLIFTEVFDHINELMTDPFSNYLLQKLIEHCTSQQRLKFIQSISQDLVAIALNMHGTRVVQKMVEMASMNTEIDCLIDALKNSVVIMCKDLNGNHVIQRCLHHLQSINPKTNQPHNQFIYDSIIRSCVSVATHKHGCCVMQRCIDYASPNQKKALINEIVSNTLELVQDAFGNYVVQYCLDLGDASTITAICNQLVGNVSSLSVQKFSSNVVEKCLELANDRQRQKLIEELIHVDRLPRLLQDPYANYVLQACLRLAKKPQFERLVAIIKPHLHTLRNTAFGKRISAKIVRKFPHMTDGEEDGSYGPDGLNTQSLNFGMNGIDSEPNSYASALWVGGLQRSMSEGRNSRPNTSSE